jgi:hypothetical protein
MHLAPARSILASFKTPSSRSVSHGADLIWAEHGDEVDQWNAVAATQGWGEITVRYEEHPGQMEAVFYTYRGYERQCPIEGDREDNLRSVLMIAELVRADAKLFACNAHCGNGEQGFLALSPAQWRSLEAEFGNEAMAFCFTRANGTFDEFSDKYYSNENMDRYSEPDKAPVTDTLGEAQAPAAASLTGKERAANLARKHWLLIGFFAFMLALLIFGR